MPSYHFWTPDDLKGAILRVERQMTTGASQIASPTEGSTTLVSRGQAEAILEGLYQAYERKTGEKIERAYRQTQIKTYQINVVPGYYDR